MKKTILSLMVLTGICLTMPRDMLNLFTPEQNDKNTIVLGTIPTPEGSPRDYIDNIFATYKGYTTQFKADLTQSLQRASNNGLIFITPLSDFQAMQDKVISKQKFKSGSLEEKFSPQDVLSPFKQLSHQWTTNPQTISELDQNINQKMALILMRFNKSRFLGLVEKKSTYGSVTSRLVFKKSATTIISKGIIIFDEKTPLYNHCATPSSTGSEKPIDPELIAIDSVHQLAHEATHISNDCTKLTLEAEEKKLPEDSRNFLKQKIETLCDLAGAQIKNDLFDNEKSIEHTKILTLVHLKEALLSGRHDHFTSPALSTWIAKQDPSFTWCANELNQLSNQDILDGVTEGKKLLRANTLQSYKNAADVAQTRGAKIMLTTAFKLQQQYEQNKL